MVVTCKQNQYWSLCESDNDTWPGSAFSEIQHIGKSNTANGPSLYLPDGDTPDRLNTCVNVCWMHRPFEFGEVMMSVEELVDSGDFKQNQYWSLCKSDNDTWPGSVYSEIWHAGKSNTANGPSLYLPDGDTPDRLNTCVNMCWMHRPLEFGEVMKHRRTCWWWLLANRNSIDPFVNQIMTLDQEVRSLKFNT